MTESVTAIIEGKSKTRRTATKSGKGRADVSYIYGGSLVTLIVPFWINDSITFRFAIRKWYIQRLN